jgi:hypothetical protein
VRIADKIARNHDWLARLIHDVDRRAILAVGVALAAAIPACSAPTRAPLSAGPEPSIPLVGTRPETFEGCVDGTVVELGGSQGVISAGPLAVNGSYWRQEQGTKFWVASTRNQVPTSAYIEARRLDGMAEPVRVKRGPDQLATVLATPPAAGLFYPGTLRIPQQGRWQITVRIGPDMGCFVVLVS